MLVIVGCGKQKAERASAPARELYTGPSVRLQLELAERTTAGDPSKVAILSMRYGLISPDRVVANYDRSPRDLDKSERAAWGERVARDLARRTEPGETVYVLAGGDYISPWRDHELVADRNIVAPMEGLARGQRLAWLKQAIERGIWADDAPSVGITGDPELDRYLVHEYSVDSWARIEPRDLAWGPDEPPIIGAREPGQPTPVWSSCPIGGVPQLASRYHDRPWSEIPRALRRWVVYGVLIDLPTSVAFYRNLGSDASRDTPARLLQSASGALFDLGREIEPRDPETAVFAANLFDQAAALLCPVAGDRPTGNNAAVREVAALYVDPKGPYVAMPGVDAWTSERDARRYQGPHPVVAHPPCADWSRLHGLAKNVEGRRDLAPLAVWQVRACGGVLEHPAHSALWRELGLPLPGGLPDAWGGWTIQVDQVAWGHPAVKPTWLYFVGVPRSAVEPRTGGTPTHVVSTTRRDTPLLRCSALKRRLTPPSFAAWLVELARGSRMQPIPAPVPEESL